MKLGCRLRYTVIIVHCTLAVHMFVRNIPAVGVAVSSQAAQNAALHVHVLIIVVQQIDILQVCVFTVVLTNHLLT